METATHTARRLTLARLPSGVAVETTLHRYEGAHEGPTLYVQAAQHGREVNGTATLRRFHERLDLEALAGTVLAVPVADPLTFDRVSYTTPEKLDDVNPNMNRAWPGDADGTLHERMAATLWKHAGGADAIVDLHTGSPKMLTHVVFREDDPDSRRLAEAFGTDLLLAERAEEDADEEWADRDFDGKLRVVATGEGIPAITPELAYNKRIVDDAVETGVTGLFNVLRKLEMLEGGPEINGEPVLARNHLGRVRATESGLFRSNRELELGDRIAAGTPLGTLYDPTTYGVLDEPVADRDGVLYALTEEATVTGGEDLANVALVLD